MMKILKHVILLTMLIVCNNSFAQKQNNEWRFGNAGAIDFNTQPPTFVAGCPISTIEGSASVADRITGALLFYTNGGKVWNANNQVMPNGTGLSGGTALLSSTTAAVIVPKPGSCNLYYIVTVDEIGSNNGVRYSVVDMTLNGGLGDIVPSQKNIFLYQTNKEKLEVVPASDGLSFWLIACSSNNEFVSFKIDNAGIQATPVISAVLQNTPYPAGHMKINRQFNKIASGSYTGIVVFDFDNATGIVSNPIAWNLNLGGGFAYGIEFSPDGNVLYIGDLIAILQYDLTQTTPLAIQNSLYQVTTGANIDANCSLQLGIDEKIYVNSISGSLSAINSPNNLGVACGFQTNVIANQTGGSGLGLPKWIYYANDIPIANSNGIVYSDSCFGNATQFSIQDISGISSISWNFNDPASSASNAAVGFIVKHTFSQIGNFKIQAIINTACGTDTLFKTLTITNCDSAVAICELYTPNSFTPNGDMINDNFYPLTNCTFEQYEFLIFNSWGELIFKTLNQTDKWDGKYKGSDCSSGVYVSKITYKFPLQQIKNAYKPITLLR